MSFTDIKKALLETFTTLQIMQKAEEGGEILAEVVCDAETEEKSPGKINPADSIKEDRIVCIECGVEMKQLTAKHLSTHDLNPREYRKKYGIPLKTPLSARALTKARSKAAKKRGLPENLVKFQEERRQMKAAAGAPIGTAPETGGPEGEQPAKPAGKKGRKNKAA